MNELQHVAIMKTSELRRQSNEIFKAKVMFSHQSNGIKILLLVNYVLIHRAKHKI